MSGARPDPGIRDGDAADAAWMARALAAATAGWGQVAPNPLVGAVLVRDGLLLAEGAHRQFGGPHAEIDALSRAGGRARGATLYVTLEPCAHHGKTPPCTDAIIAAGVRRVVVAIRDPNPAAGGGADILRAAGMQVDIGVLSAAAAELNAPFLHAFRSDRPWVTLKLALSLDGAIAASSGSTTWLTGAAARRHVHHLRAGHDAIAVGMGTVRADDPRLTVRDAPAPRVPPVRVIFSRRGGLPAASQLARGARDVPVIVYATEPSPGAPEDAPGIDVVATDSLAGALRDLRARNVHSVLVEGGAAIATAFINEHLVDRLVLYRAPVLLGRQGVPAFGTLSADAVQGRWRQIRAEWFDDDHMTVFAPPER